MMGILSASYTVPGILVSKKLANIINKLNDRTSLIMFDLLRVIVLIGIVLTSNVWGCTNLCILGTSFCDWK